MAASADPAASYRLGVLVPAYNEESTIADVLRRVLAVPGLDEVVVVDDGSADNTGREAESVNDPRVVVLRHAVNRGKTAAIQTAIDQAKADILIVQDADLEYDPDEIPAVVAPIREGKADVVYGSRFMVRRASRVLYFSHFVANKLITATSNVLTNHNMTDVETCYKAFRAPLLKRMKLTSSGFGMEIELTAFATKLPLRIYEVPISYYGRTYAEGKKIGMFDGVMAFVYLGWFNLVAPYTARGRAYLANVRQDLGLPPAERGPVSAILALLAWLLTRPYALSQRLAPLVERLRSPTERSHSGRFLVPIAFLLLGLAATYATTWTSGLAELPGDLGDTRLNLVQLEHGWQVVSGGSASVGVASNASLHPFAASHFTCDTLSSFAPLYWPWRALGADEHLAMFGWTLAVSTLNFLAFYLFLRRVVRTSRVGAALGAIVFAFGLSRVAMSGHPQMSPAFYIVLALAGLWRYVEGLTGARTGRRALALVAAGLVLQFWGAVYVFFFFAGALLLLLVGASLDKRVRPLLIRAWREDRLWAAGIALASALLLAPAIAGYLEARALEPAWRTWAAVAPMAPRPYSWFFIADGSTWYGGMGQLSPWADLPMPHEHAYGHGIVVVLAALVGLAAWRKRNARRVLLLLCAAIVLVSTSWFGQRPLFRQAWDHLPGFDVIRALGRITWLLAIPIGIGLALYVDRKRPRAWWGWAAMVALLCLVEQHGPAATYTRSVSEARIARIATAIDGEAAAFVPLLDAPLAEPPTNFAVDAMLASLRRGVPTLTGCGGVWPPEAFVWFLDPNVSDPAQAVRIDEALAAWTTKHGLAPARIQRLVLSPPR